MAKFNFPYWTAIIDDGSGFPRKFGIRGPLAITAEDALREVRRQQKVIVNLVTKATALPAGKVKIVPRDMSIPVPNGRGTCEIQPISLRAPDAGDTDHRF